MNSSHSLNNRDRTGHGQVNSNESKGKILVVYPPLPPPPPHTHARFKLYNGQRSVIGGLVSSTTPRKKRVMSRYHSCIHMVQEHHSIGPTEKMSVTSPCNVSCALSRLLAHLTAGNTICTGMTRKHLENSTEHVKGHCLKHLHLLHLAEVLI